MESRSLEKVIIQNQKGFSLIEILIALTLLIGAGTFVVGRFMDSLNEGQVKSTKIQMSNIDSRLKDFRRKCGFYPTTEQGLDSLVTKPTSGRECKDYPPNGFIDGDQVPQDPWNNDFVYDSDGKVFNIISYGPDGEQGGEGTDADIYFKAVKGAEGTAGDKDSEAAPE
ncbi:MAG: type II secretion system major pseudopilin GspG [Bacteriovoracaceae bacterium]|nr:type II secretion system major pseudopilin GspG [Bacteriovoracaceae bacterium]